MAPGDLSSHFPRAPFAMPEQNLHAFINAVLWDSALQVQLSTTAAADADEVAAIARAPLVGVGRLS